MKVIKKPQVFVSKYALTLKKYQKEERITSFNLLQSSR